MLPQGTWRDVNPPKCKIKAVSCHTGLLMASHISFQQKTEKEGYFSAEQTFLHIKPHHQNTKAD